MHACVPDLTLSVALSDGLMDVDEMCLAARPTNHDTSLLALVNANSELSLSER